MNEETSLSDEELEVLDEIEAYLTSDKKFSKLLSSHQSSAIRFSGQLVIILLGVVLGLAGMVAFLSSSVWASFICFLIMFVSLYTLIDVYVLKILASFKERLRERYDSYQVEALKYHIQQQRLPDDEEKF